MPVRLGPVTVKQLIAKLQKLPPTAVVRGGVIESNIDAEMAEMTVVLAWPIGLDMPPILARALKESTHG